MIISCGTVDTQKVLHLNSTWSGKPMIHLLLPWEIYWHSTVINNGRGIPLRSQRGIFPECLKVYMCKLVHICVTIYLSSWTSITTSHWIIQNYKIKEHPHACWRINGFINDEWEDDEPKRSSILQATLIHFHMWHCVHTHVFACTLRKCKHSHKGIL